VLPTFRLSPRKLAVFEDIANGGVGGVALWRPLCCLHKASLTHSGKKSVVVAATATSATCNNNLGNVNSRQRHPGGTSQKNNNISKL